MWLTWYVQVSIGTEKIEFFPLYAHMSRPLCDQEFYDISIYIHSYGFSKRRRHAVRNL